MEIRKLEKKLNKLSDIKIGLLADLHLSIHRKENIFFPHIENTINYFIEMCEIEKVDVVIITGDIFDTKNIISTSGLIKSNKAMNKIFNKFPTIMITGNHDLAVVDNHEVNLVSNYKELENVVVVDKYSTIETKHAVWHLLPWSKDPREDLEKIDTGNDKENILFSHFGVKGFSIHESASIYANNNAAKVEQSDLIKFSCSFLGHYHGHQSKNKITFVSAPFQSRHGDETIAHGFITMLEKDAYNNFKFIENIYTPEFKSFILTKESINIMLGLKDHYIRIFVKQHVRKDLLYKLKHKLLANNYDVKIIWDVKDEGNKLSVIEGWKDFVLNDVDDLIIEYLDILRSKQQLPFDKKDLLECLEINLK